MLPWRQLGEFLRRLRMLLSDGQLERELDEEMRLHRELRARQLATAGIPPEEAEAAARRRFGNALRLREESRDAWGWRWIDDLGRDLRYAARALTRSPGFTAVAVLTLALGVGANTAIFTVVDSVLLQPLPFPQSNRLVTVGTLQRSFSHPTATSAPDFLDWSHRAHSIELAAYSGSGFTLRTAAEPVLLEAAEVSGDYFRVLGIQPALGRDFLPSEDEPGHNHAVILSYGVWQRQFAGHPAVIGEVLNFDGAAYTIVGVMPRGFDYPIWAQIWVPLGLAETGHERGSHYLAVVGRLRPGFSSAEAQSELTGIEQDLVRQYPKDNGGRGAHLSSLEAATVRNLPDVFSILFVATGLVLLIACGDVANLALARAVARSREMAVRAALGAARGRLARQTLTESLLLALMGGGAGLLLAYGGVRALMALAPAGYLPRLKPVRMDGWALVFTLVATLVTAILFGWTPALRAARADMNQALRRNGLGSARRVRGQWLIGGAVAISLLLLVCAGLLMGSFLRLTRVDPGFRPGHLLTLGLDPPDSYLASNADPQRLDAFYNRLLAAVAAVPGVRGAAISNSIPSGEHEVDSPFEIEGSATEGKDVIENFVSPGYLRVIGISVIRGRGLTARDDRGAAPVAVISKTLAVQYWPGVDPVDRYFAFDGFGPGGRARWVRIVGVAGDVRHFGLDWLAEGEAYLPSTQMPPGWDEQRQLVVRTAGEPLALALTLRRLLSRLEDQPVWGIATLDHLLDSSLAPYRFQTTLLGVFAAVALLLALAGVYGVTTYTVRQRHREIGLRLAVGASRGGVVRLIVGQGLAPIAVGIAAGEIGALLLARTLRSLLSGVGALGAATLAEAAVFLLAIGAAACWLPARRAARIDPAVTLRDDG